ncbi:hypothetical protein NC652_005557 [Populus alba x Populus x berolinensis]|nr:hypothetical protein NC652_005557 [Populus alba x Populus x berolinensis]
MFPKFYNGACFEKKGSRFVDERINDCTMLSLSPSKSLAFQVEEMEISTVFYLSLGSLFTWMDCPYTCATEGVLIGSREGSDNLGSALGSTVMTSSAKKAEEEYDRNWRDTWEEWIEMRWLESHCISQCQAPLNWNSGLTPKEMARRKANGSSAESVLVARLAGALTFSKWGHIVGNQKMDSLCFLYKRRTLNVNHQYIQL